MLNKSVLTLGCIGIMLALFMTMYSLYDILLFALQTNLVMFFFILAFVVGGYGIVTKRWWKFISRISQ